MTQLAARTPSHSIVFVGSGAALIAAGLWASLADQAWASAAFLGAAGLALWRVELSLSPGPWWLIIVDAAAFAIFAVFRNNAIGFWQLPGPWKDVPFFNVSGAAIAYAVYLCGALGAMLVAKRGLTLVEALSLIATPFLFNLTMTIAADWHMQELGALLTLGVSLPFQGQVLAGRVVDLFTVAEAMLLAFSTMRVGRPVADPRLHALVLAAAAL